MPINTYHVISNGFQHATFAQIKTGRNLSLASVALLVEASARNGEVTGSIPGQGTCPGCGLYLWLSRDRALGVLLKDSI